mmetsp:Transcript_11863/g.36103  ORF Transcript_11863/g.36103 Transcript_11863/m.36103 type:complete len:97 (-) Transcript_11863:72-362(-)|eukprot:CAMPEP_0177669950 /NCGR_PEP_ID=MMETSP0447-20121125/23792_1 /TAXON_ID=0 /ORGANISM="Stygamoeba regulata, Strain BSH-02190019" /LENGTH=96 /DNA_ID=CAMNT_0019177007 /DNA_START=12 /DNA_END=302 /DNA_ORIENTATION=+
MTDHTYYEVHHRVSGLVDVIDSDPLWPLHSLLPPESALPSAVMHDLDPALASLVDSSLPPLHPDHPLSEEQWTDLGLHHFSADRRTPSHKKPSMMR